MLRTCNGCFVLHQNVWTSWGTHAYLCNEVKAPCRYHPQVINGCVHYPLDTQMPASRISSPPVRRPKPCNGPSSLSFQWVTAATPSATSELGAELSSCEVHSPPPPHPGGQQQQLMWQPTNSTLPAPQTVPEPYLMLTARRKPSELANICSFGQLGMHANMGCSM